LWPGLEGATKDSFFKILVIKIIGILYLEIEKDGKKKIHLKLKSQLEEILTDKTMNSKKYLAFGLKEQTAAAKSLEKIGYKGKALQDWKKNHNLA
jgi:hypothetical protein